MMPDDKTKRGSADRARVSSKESYEMRDLAKKTGLPVPLVTKVTQQVGPMRQNVEQKLKEMKRNGKK